VVPTVGKKLTQKPSGFLPSPTTAHRNRRYETVAAEHKCVVLKTLGRGDGEGTSFSPGAAKG
jgi:hypothetical protein